MPSEQGARCSEIYKLEGGCLYLWLVSGKPSQEAVNNLMRADAVVASGVVFTVKQAQQLEAGNYVVLMNPLGDAPLLM